MSNHRLMLFNLQQQLTQDIAEKIAKYYDLPSCVVDEIRRETPGKSLITALEQQRIICENENKLRDLHETLLKMKYYNLTEIIEEFHPQLKQDDAQHHLIPSAPPLTESNDLYQDAEKMVKYTHIKVDGKGHNSGTEMAAPRPNLKMNIYLRKVLRKCIYDMEEGLEPMDVMDSLIAQRIMTVEDKTKLELIESQTEKIRTFVSLLEENNENAFHGFLDVLKSEEYNELVEKLQTLERSEKEIVDKNIEEILTFLGDTEQFIFCEMVCNIAQTITKVQAGKLTELYKFSEHERKLLRGSEYPGFHVLKILLGKGFQKAAIIDMLEADLRDLKLTTLVNILEKFREDMYWPALVINVKCPKDFEISRERKALFETGRLLSSYFRNNFDVIFDDYTPQNTLIIRISSLSSLESVIDGIQSGTMAAQIVPLISDKQLYENVNALQVECNEKDYKRVENHLLIDAKKRKEVKSADREKSFQSYLRNVGLYEHYPSKMTLEMATKVRLLYKYSPKVKPSDIPFLFLTMLTSLDCRVVLPEVLKFKDSVRDFIWALLHCSDDFLKQHILEKLASCQIAVPIVIPKPTGESPIFILWALRRIVKSWKDDDSLITERNVCTEPVFTVAFLRIGKLPVSKSHILNNMFGRAQSNATAVYFISKREDNQSDPLFSKGSLEAHWYVPLEKRNGEILEKLTLFLNLRGDANNFPEQVSFAGTVANMVFILIDRASESQNRKLVDRIKHISSKVVVVSLKKNLRSTCNTSFKLLECDDRFEYDLQEENVVLSQTLCEVIKMHCQTLNMETYKCIQDWKSACRSLEINICIDEDNVSCQNGIKMSEEATENLKSLEIKEIKEQALILQNLELEWVKLDHKRLTENDNDGIEIYEDDIQRKKSRVRKEQISRGLTSGINSFYLALHNAAFSDDRKLLHYFMSHFQAQISNMVKREISPHLSNLAQLEEKLFTHKIKMRNEKDKSTIEAHENLIRFTQLLILKESEEYIHKHLGFEHFMRELSQLFEAKQFDQSNDHDESWTIASIAARLLIEGYPLELLNGDSANISMSWITTILSIVDEKLNSPTIFVVSAIGVQSSGKSTLLNCMFGVHLTARAGKCTRGIFLQLLEVEESLKKTMGFQYLLLIDTEGLQSPDRTVKNNYKFDNTIATLSMCIVDLSILNLSQENIGSNSIGILQIAAHALIRMREVKLVSGCCIVHHRVSALNAESENKSSVNMMKDALDRATFAAAKEENVTNIKEFSDVFPFTESNNLYIPPLWIDNMSPPNSAYSESILNLKSRILSWKGENGSVGRLLTLRKFKRRLQDVWEALKEEDFVLNFQNSFNALSYQRFCLEHNKWIAVMRTAMVEWELCNKTNVKESNKHNYDRELENEIKRQQDKVLWEIDEYVKMHSDEEEVIRQQNAFKSSAMSIAQEIEDTIKSNFRYFMTTKREKESLPSFIRNCKIELRNKAKQKAIEVRQNDPALASQTNKDQLDEMFEKLWNDTTEKLKQTYNKMKVEDKEIINACESSLITLIRNTQYNLKFNKIITEKGGKIFSGEIAFPVQKQSKHSKMKITRILNLRPLPRKDKEEKDSDGKQQIDKIALGELNMFLSDERYEAFDKNRIDKFFTVLFEKLKKYMSVAGRHVLETLVLICNHVATQSIYKQTEFEEKYSLYKLIEAEKNSMKNNFISDFDETITTESATEHVAEEINSELCAIIRDKIIDHLNVKLLERLRRLNWFVDKQTLIGTILCEICNQASKEKYAQFISNEDEFINQWLQSREIEEITKKENSILWIETVASEKLLSLKQMIINSLRTTKSHLDEKYPTPEDLSARPPAPNGTTKVSISKECNISHWQNVFVEKCDKEGIVVNLEPKTVDIVHFISLSEILFKKIQDLNLSNIQMEPNIRSCEEQEIARELISKMEISPHHEILKQLKGCSEVCPFCKVGCYRQGEHSEHKATLHYPQGLAGVRNVVSKKLSVDICTSLVASSCTYRFRSKPKHGSYKNYRKEFSTWYIASLRRDKPTQHWQWVMAQYNDYFADLYKCKPGVIPPGWKNITKNEALLSLKQSYNLE